MNGIESGGTRQPEFSIVMPAYNVEQYLCDAIVMIERQTFDDWELIVVDDASTDSTGEMAEALAAEDPRIRVIHHPENRWLSEARNTGIEAARGRYLWICDPDDKYDPSLLQTCVDALEDNPVQLLIFAHVQQYYDASGTHLYDNPIISETGVYLTPDELRPHVLGLEQDTSLGYTWNKIYDLALVRRTGLHFETTRLVDDIMFNLVLLRDVESMMVIDKPLYFYAKREKGSLTGEFVEEYYPLHRLRIQTMRDNLDSWGLLDDEAKGVLGSLYGRYILSELEHHCEKAAHMNRRQREEWLRGVFEDPLFEELIPHAHAESGSMLDLCLTPLKDRRVKGSLRLARLIHFTKRHFYTLFTKVRSQR